MRNAKTSIASALLSAFLLAACTTPASQQESGIEVQPFWSRLTASTEPRNQDLPLASSPNVQVEHDWWKHFGDSTLDTLIAEALANNKTLQIAKARVEEARATRSIARARLFPEVVGSASASRGNQGARRIPQPPEMGTPRSRDPPAGPPRAPWFRHRQVVLPGGP